VCCPIKHPTATAKTKIRAVRHVSKRESFMNVDLAITGRHVHEIKAVLQSVGTNERTEYAALPFNPASRASGHHSFAFRNKQAALEATTTWDTISSNPHIRIADPVRPSVMIIGRSHAGRGARATTSVF